MKNELTLETDVQYFHSLDCEKQEGYRLKVPFPEGTLRWCNPNVNCCKKVKKTWDELPDVFKEFLKGIEDLARRMENE